MTSPVTPEMFVGYLRERLIPDLRASGSDATAEDFETAADWIEQLRANGGKAWYEVDNDERQERMQELYDARDGKS